MVTEAGENLAVGAAHSVALACGTACALLDILFLLLPPPSCASCIIAVDINKCKVQHHMLVES
jgi:hypothetical protein